jgi:hypothetical protein
MGPFSSIMITHDSNELNFGKVTVRGDGGNIETVKSRS